MTAPRRFPRIIAAETLSRESVRGPFSEYPNHILQAEGKDYFWEGVGPLSIKMFLGGTAHYNAGGGSFAVTDESYLVLNHQQTYSIRIESPMPVESFCLFFRAGLAEEVQRTLTRDTDSLLDEPFGATAAPLHFFERTHPHDDLLSPVLSRLRWELESITDASACEPGWVEETMHTVMARLVMRHQAIRREIDSFGDAPSSLRVATREELYRRLHRARDFVVATHHQSPTLDDMARVACLSPNHFLRSFKMLFHETPHQFLTNQRLATACRLLRRTELSVTDICLRVGFVSLGSFSRLFTHHFGISPERFRHKEKPGDFG